MDVDSSGFSLSRLTKGYEPLISTEALHQLHILIFFLAVFHVLYSAVTMLLGRLKIRGWKKWEQETSTNDYEFSNDPSRFRLTYQTSFVRAHTSFWTKLPIIFYINAFQITYFFWIWYSFGLNSCFHANIKLAILKVALGVVVLVLCSYITLPLYALVTQMGSRMKRSIFNEQTSEALKKWHTAVKKRKRGKSPTRTPGESVSLSPSTVHSQGGHRLQRFKTTGQSTRSYTYDDNEASDNDANPSSPKSPTGSFVINVDKNNDGVIEVNEPHHGEDNSNEGDLSFVNPALANEP